MSLRTKYNWQGTGEMAYYDSSTYETKFSSFPVYFEDDFLGYTLQKYTAAEDTHSKWKTVETQLNTAIGLAANIANGAVDIIVDSDDIAAQGTLYWGDQLGIGAANGPILETRLCFPVLPTTGTETVQAVFGFASADNATADTISINAWFRVESAAQTALLWETDDNSTNDDDNATGITLVASTYNIYRIDCTDLTAVKFYVDGTLVGTGSLAALTTETIQPYFTVSKAKSSANTGTGTMRIDYVRIWSERS